MHSIKKFYQDQNVFITGGTGFLGKVLIEKLARSCSDVNNIYVLMRPRKGMHIQQRLDAITNIPLFDRLKTEYPENLKKIVPVSGDCMKVQLGLSEDDRKMLEDNVSVVFHSAASVRFDDTLTYAVTMNMKATYELMKIARNMKKIKALVHVSTSYSNCDREEIDEIMYPPHADWRKIIAMVETIDEQTLNILTPKIINKLPNTYIFTKQLAEHIIKDLSGNIPVVILRPSIVVSTVCDPIVGWIDNFNGPMGLLVAGGKGVVRVSYGNHDTIMDLIPVDVAIKVMIISAYHAANIGAASEPYIYNVVSGTKKRITLQKLINMGIKLNEETPLENMIWKECGMVTNNIFRYYWRLLYTQLLPAVILDFVIKLSGHEPLLMRLHRRIFGAQMALHYFITKTWLFKNEKLFLLRTILPESEKEEFDAKDVEFTDDEKLVKDFLLGARIYLMKENPATIPQSKVHRTRLVWLDRIAHGVVYGCIAWITYKSEFLHSILYNMSGNLCY